VLKLLSICLSACLPACMHETTLEPLEFDSAKNLLTHSNFN